MFCEGLPSKAELDDIFLCLNESPLRGFDKVGISWVYFHSSDLYGFGMIWWLFSFFCCDEKENKLPRNYPWVCDEKEKENSKRDKTIKLT